MTLPAQWWGLQGGKRGGGFAEDCYKLSMKVLILSLSSYCPPTEIFVTKSPYFGPCENVCISINLLIDRQTEGGHEQLLHRWGLKKHRI